MQIDLSQPDLQKFIAEQVRSGRFASPTEVVEAGLARLMLDPEGTEPDEEAWQAIERAEGQFDRAEDRPFAEVAKELRAKFARSRR